MVEHDTPWKQRFRVPEQYVQVAREDPDRGLVVSNRTGAFQLYAWDPDFVQNLGGSN